MATNLCLVKEIEQRQKAEDIHLRLECCQVHLEIRDNGIGFDQAKIKPTSLGMRIMRERAEAIHAHFKVSSSLAQGTVVSLDWNEDE
jgi:signal transduction histidine kinase